MFLFTYQASGMPITRVPPAKVNIGYDRQPGHMTQISFLTYFGLKRPEKYYRHARGFIN